MSKEMKISQNKDKLSLIIADCIIAATKIEDPTKAPVDEFVEKVKLLNSTIHSIEELYKA
jgi:hypothetical protein